MAARRKLDVTDADEACEDSRHRLCAITRLARPTNELIRFVEGPDGGMVPDLRQKLPGRGVWITANRTSLERAIKAKAFQRSLKHPVTVDLQLPDLVDQLLQASALAALSFANKAGALTLGFERVMEAIGGGKTAALVHASDAASDGRRKLDGRRRAALAEDSALKTIDCFSNEQLSLALGRPNVVHAALFGAPAAKNFIEQTERLLRFRSGFGFVNGPDEGPKDGIIRHE
jgi:uncharacterized protein